MIKLQGYLICPYCDNPTPYNYAEKWGTKEYCEICGEQIELKLIVIGTTIDSSMRENVNRNQQKGELKND